MTANILCLINQTDYNLEDLTNLYIFLEHLNVLGQSVADFFIAYFITQKYLWNQ